MNEPLSPQSSDDELRSPPRRLTAFEAQLASLQPNANRLDRERLMFLAGQVSAAAGAAGQSPRRRWGWPAAFGAMTTAAATLLAMLAVRNDTRDAGTAPPTVGARTAEQRLSPPEDASGGPRSRQGLLTAGADLVRIDRLLAGDGLSAATWPALSPADAVAARPGEILNARSLREAADDGRSADASS